MHGPSKMDPTITTVWFTKLWVHLQKLKPVQNAHILRSSILCLLSQQCYYQGREGESFNTVGCFIKIFYFKDTSDWLHHKHRGLALLAKVPKLPK